MEKLFQGASPWQILQTVSGNGGSSIILFIMNPAIGHYNAAFPFARKLKENNYSITFASTLQYKDLIEKQGFTFINFEYINSFGFDLIPGTLKTAIRLLYSNIKNKPSNLKRRVFQAEAEQFIKMIHVVRPSMILVDSFLPNNTLFIKNFFHIPVYSVETCLNTAQRVNVPPLNSSFVPTNSFVSRTLCRLKWRLNHTKQALQRMLDLSVNLNEDYRHLLRRYFRSGNIPLKYNFRFKRTFFPAIQDVKEIILPPNSLDFTSSDQKSDVYYFYNRNLIPPTGDQNKSEVLALIENLKKNRKLIYCSFGTVAHIHYTNIKFVLKQIIEQIGRQREYVLIISLANVMNTRDLQEHLHPNTYLFDQLPQVDVLRSADLAILHGGINSIVECVWTEVPMIVFPLSKKWDHRGNAARVMQHGIGSVGKIGRIRRTLIPLIESTLNDTRIKNNLRRLKTNFCLEENQQDIKTLFDLSTS